MQHEFRVNDRSLQPAELNTAVLMEGAELLHHKQADVKQAKLYT